MFSPFPLPKGDLIFSFNAEIEAGDDFGDSATGPEGQESNKTTSLVRRLSWFYVVVLCDWLNNLAPLSKPIKSNTKPNS